MKILLTNDDGIDSPGLHALEDSLSLRHEIITVAPAGERSGYSNSITFRKPVMIQKIGINRYSCSGTPVDCVHRTLHGIFDGFYPDAVVSGINKGPNLGTDIIYSGTAAAARQASIMGIPGIAVSVSSFTEPFHFSRAAEFIADNIDFFMKNWNRDHFINVNVPSTAVISGSYEIMVTRPSKRVYTEKVIKKGFEDSGSMEVILDISGAAYDDVPGTDCYAVERGMVSVCPVFVQPVSDRESEKLYKRDFCGIKDGKKL